MAAHWYLDALPGTRLLQSFAVFFAVSHTQFLYQFSPKLPCFAIFRRRRQGRGVTMYCWPKT
jgi:hypothetical protein